MLYAQFLVYEADKPLLARRALLMAESRKPSLDVAFVIMKLKKHMQMYFLQKTNLAKFIESEKHRKLVDQSDKACLMALTEFWHAPLAGAP